MSVLALCAVDAVRAADGLTPEQARLRDCNARAKAQELKDGERRRFMSACLNGRGGNGQALTPKQRRGEECSRLARERGLQAAERRGFLSACTQPAAERSPGDCRRRAAGMRLEPEERLRYINGCVEGART